VREHGRTSRTSLFHVAHALNTGDHQRRQQRDAAGVEASWGHG